MGQVDAIVAGAGIWGCTVARVLAENGRKVLVLEKRPHVGGNVRCETDPETGIEVHTYGSHIFHTHIDRVWDFVRRFVEFNGYQHKVLARHAGKTYFLPLGLALVNQFYGLDLKPSELPDFIAAEAGRGTRPCVPANFEEQAIAFIGKPRTSICLLPGFLTSSSEYKGPFTAVVRAATTNTRMAKRLPDT